MGLTPVGGSEKSFSEYFDLRMLPCYLHFIQVTIHLSFKPMLLILSTARFTGENSQQSIIAGASGIIGCSAEGTPTPTIEWKRQDGIPLDKGRFTQLSNGSLYVKPVHPQDNGTYICTFIQSKGKKRVTRKKQTISVCVISEYQIL